VSASNQALPRWLLSGPPLDELTAALRDVHDFFAASGGDVSDFIARVVRTAHPELAGLEPDLNVVFAIDAETEINECYRKLRALAASPDGAEYSDTLSRLRALQEDEARRLSSVFRSNVDLDLLAFETTLTRADALLATHEDPPKHD